MENPNISGFSFILLYPLTPFSPRRKESISLSPGERETQRVRGHREALKYLAEQNKTRLKVGFQEESSELSGAKSRPIGAVLMTCHLAGEGFRMRTKTPFGTVVPLSPLSRGTARERSEREGVKECKMQNEKCKLQNYPLYPLTPFSPRRKEDISLSLWRGKHKG